MLVQVVLDIFCKLKGLSFTGSFIRKYKKMTIRAILAPLDFKEKDR